MARPVPPAVEEDHPPWLRPQLWKTQQEMPNTLSLTINMNNVYNEAALDGSTRSENRRDSNSHSVVCLRSDLRIFSTVGSNAQFCNWLQHDAPAIITNVVRMDRKLKKEFNLSEGARRILTVPNAGGNSVWSEVLSFEVLTGCFGAKLLRTEMELQYMWDNCKITDYSVQVPTCSLDSFVTLGISVTRAMKYSGTFDRNDANKLLEKKLGGVNSSSQYVLPSNGWKKQILHIWATEKYIAKELQSAYELLSEELKANTLLLISVSDAPLIYAK